MSAESSQDPEDVPSKHDVRSERPEQEGLATVVLQQAKSAFRFVGGGAFREVSALSTLLLVWALLLYVVAGWIPLPQVAYAQDLGIVFEAGWRFLQGQFPHRDYISPLGPIFSLYAGLPLKWFGTTYASYGHMQGYVGAVFSVVSFFAVRRTMPITLTVCYSLVVGVVAGGTYHMGGPPNLTTTATVFNRHCWAVVMILAAACCLGSGRWRKPESDVGEVVSGAICGLLIAVLLFYKINFFVAGVGLLVVALVSRSIALDSYFVGGASLAFLLASIAIGSLFSFDFSGMARDLSYALAARKGNFVNEAHFFSPLRVLQSNLWEIWACLALLLALLGRRMWGAATCVAGVSLLGFGLMNTNSSQSGAGVPLLFSAVVIGAVRLCYGIKRDTATAILAGSMVVGVGGLSLLWPQIISWQAWATASDVVKKSGQKLSASGTPLEGLYDSSDNMWGNEFWPRVNEGRSLIRNSVCAGQTLLYVDFTNIFNFAGEAASPRGVFLWLDHTATFSTKDGYHLSPKEMFADVDFVMFPKRPLLLETVNMWLKLYEAEMNKLFFKIDETENFYLLARLNPRKRRVEQGKRSPGKGM